MVAKRNITGLSSKSQIPEQGALRIGSGMISASFPAVRVAGPAISERGALRIGSGMISARFPEMKAVKDRGRA